MLFFKRAINDQATSLRYGENEVPFRVIRSKKRRRTVSLSVKPGEGLRLLAPMRITQRDIARILNHRAEWIARQFTRLAEESASHNKPLEEGQVLPFMGKDLTLFFDPQATVAYRVENQIICNPENAAEELATFYMEEAERYLKIRLEAWAMQLGLPYASFSLSNARRLWGSCSGHNAIRINWRIIMAPAEVIDYLLVHELCHIAHKSHGVRFWEKVASILPDYRQRQAVLRQHENAWLSRFRKAN